MEAQPQSANRDHDRRIQIEAARLMREAAAVRPELALDLETMARSLEVAEDPGECWAGL